MAHHQMRRSVIMSHGGVHNAKGVKGTYMKGSAPPAKVMATIPASQDAVAELVEPGKAGAKPARPAFVFDPVEGTILKGPSSQRPEVDTDERSPAQREEDAELDKFIEDSKPVKAPEPDPVPSLAPPAEEEAPEASEDAGEPAEALVEEDATAESQEAPEASEEAPSVPFPTSKRKANRASRNTLVMWCAALGIDLQPHTEAGEEITAVTMRGLIIETLNL